MSGRGMEDAPRPPAAVLRLLLLLGLLSSAVYRQSSHELIMQTAITSRISGMSGLERLEGREWSSSRDRVYEPYFET